MEQSVGEVVGRAALSGTAAALASTAVLAATGQHEARSPFAPTNATSHWLWGDRAARKDRASARFTGLGFATHHAASVFWALVYESASGRRREPVRAVATGLAVAALACFVDYQLTPRRFQPGYERRLSRAALTGVYAAFGIGLALRDVFNGRAAGRRPRR